MNGTEVRDGAHTPEAVDWLLERLPEPRSYVVVASILDDKDAAGILARLAGSGPDAGRDAVDERAGAPRGGRRPGRRRMVRPRRNGRRPAGGLLRAHELGQRVLVTGSLYLLADLAASD